jgi:tetratricopeptide (TPR) repeat protein
LKIVEFQFHQTWCIVITKLKMKAMKKLAIKLKIFCSVTALLIASAGYGQAAQENISDRNVKVSFLDLSSAVAADNIKTTIPDPVNSAADISTDRTMISFESYTDYRKAIADYTKAIEFNARDGEAYYNRGMAEFKLNLTDIAYEDFSKAGEAGYIMAFEAIRKYCKFEGNRGK